ncbi:hypothetical protein [Stakelama saccharophila]|uniref:Glycosyltransferase 2-like domain-containing protein n=1 Tax=Stakelama saccharophila TaxID=3075605 RepID=A0ABZ0B626_9SPHN|nr:hypothetical protein [Stakelama sp. W311]WNO52851.1 hypothetical protein RPR59_10320 [Stakelama sp. W311]
MKDSFTFGIPLIAADAAQNWHRIDQLLRATLRSLRGQDDQDFRVLVVGNDRPACWAEVEKDDRFTFVSLKDSPEAPTDANDDAGVKRWIIRKRVRDQGGGLLMLFDADDVIDRRTVACAKAHIRGNVRAAVVANGVAIDWRSGDCIALPHPEVFQGAFHKLCGSSTIARILPDDDPFGQLGSHHLWPENAAAQGITLERLPLWGGYMVNTRQNHSELHGPFAEWRHDFNKGVREYGSQIPAALQDLLSI